MKKILKIAPVLLILALLISITPISAKETHITGVKDLTVTQGDNITVNAHLQKEGLARNKNVKVSKRLDFYIAPVDSLLTYDAVDEDYNVGVARLYGVGDYYLTKSDRTNCLGKANVKFDTSDLQPGTYSIYVIFDRNYNFHCGEGMLAASCASAKLTVLPQET